jgi:predicted O-methyltransferase YrrM
MGSGMSTLLFSLYSQAQKVSGAGTVQIVSIEHDEQWLNETAERLITLGTRARVSLIHCELKQVPRAMGHRKSYSVNVDQVRNLLDSRGPELVFIDGPPAAVGRHETLLTIADLLKDGAEILLDDADRPGEQEVIAYWKQHFKDQLRYQGTIPAGDGLARFIYVEPSARGPGTVTRQGYPTKCAH